VRPPRSLWWDDLDAPAVARPPLAGHRDVDVAIVGGGFTGLWCARELVRRDPHLTIAVLEQAVCGYGASGRNGGWASALYPLSDDAVIARHGRESWGELRHALRAAVRELGEALEDDRIDAHYARGGSLTFARSEVQEGRLRRELARARELGVAAEDLTWLEGDALRERGFVRGARGALYTPHCARIQPARLVRGLAEALEHRGVAIYEMTRVTRILPARGGRRAEAVSAAGSVHADVVVRATEAFTPGLPGQRRSVAPLFSLMVATEPQGRAFWEGAGFAAAETFADDRHMIIYGQRTADDRIAFGGRGAPYHFASAVEPRFDEVPRVFALLAQTLGDLFGELEGEITHRWGGPLAMPRDLSPAVVLDRASGLASAGGYTGDGVVLSYLAGRTLADLIATPGVETALTRLPFTHHRPRKWEVEPARWLGINVGLALGAWADRVEEATGRTSRASDLLGRLLPKSP
jgi:glycine/D-amino acid oxidase-like deaminating enzyme